MTTALTDTDLDDTLAGLQGLAWIPGIESMLTGIREAQEAIAQGRLSADATQTLVAVVAGSAGADIVTALAHLVVDATDPAVNPALGHLPLTRQANAQTHGERARHALLSPDLHQHASEASAAISSY